MLDWLNGQNLEVCAGFHLTVMLQWPILNISLCISYSLKSHIELNVVIIMFSSPKTQKSCIASITPCSEQLSRNNACPCSTLLAVHTV